MQKFLLLITLFMLTGLATLLSGQVVTKNIIVANGGTYSDPDEFVTVTAFVPQMGLTETLATIHTHSVQGLLVHEGYAYVAAQDSLARINIDQGTVEAIVALPGANKIAIYGDMLLVSRQFPVTSEFVQLRNAGDLSLIKSFPQISDEVWDITIANDTAYVSVAGGWAAEVGSMAVIDMDGMEFVREVDLGADAVGIGSAFHYAGKLIFTCKTPWGGTTGNIIRYDLNTTQYEVFQVQGAIGKAAGIFDEQLFLVMNGNIATFSLSAMAVVDEIFIQNPFADLEITALTFDQHEEKLYVNYSYWIPPDGTGIIYNADGTQAGSYPTGVAAEEVSADHRDVTSIANAISPKVELLIYPNPCVDRLFVQNIFPGSVITITDVAGRQLVKKFIDYQTSLVLDVSGLKKGVYFLAVATLQGQAKERAIFIKQ
jgi:hypothetical protein